MADFDILTEVKIGMFGNAEGTHRDRLLTQKITEVKEFMRDAGVSDAKLNSEAAVGCIITGVNDLWYYAGGGVKFSPYFVQRVAQLAAGGDS